MNNFNWISCKDSLPPIFTTVLVTWKYGMERYVAPAYMSKNDYGLSWYAVDKNLKEYNPLRVVAWMKMPEAYEGE